jgi:arginine exporter protein ArgO
MFTIVNQFPNGWFMTLFYSHEMVSSWNKMAKKWEEMRRTCGQIVWLMAAPFCLKSLVTPAATRVSTTWV